MPNLGPMEIAIIAVVLIVLFGGAKLAGLGKSTGRALREFKEETKGLRETDNKDENAGADSGDKGSDAGAPSKDDVTRELTQGRTDTGEEQSQRADETHRDT